MPFTEKERRQWHEDKRRREAQPVYTQSSHGHAPSKVCLHCGNPFGTNGGVTTNEASICDVCLGD
jgi:formylmethanofuran dehydrogenase subunit E